ncbi:MAG: autotransporter-associated beta strand repeat-containing protein [Planctomycetota bacterium]|nr:autotransporter-associated beta strand repeat-containing protein [Planctomycetota bacterium]
MKLTRLSLRMLILLHLVGAPLTSFAADYYWDTNPNTVAAGNNIREGGSGVWNTTVANFTTDAGDSSSVNHTLWNAASVGTLGLDRVFFGGATGGTVTLDAFPAGGQLSGTLTNLGINNLTFVQTTDLTSYTLQGTNSLRFIGTNSSITVNSGVTATIANGISSAGTTGYTPDTLIDINGGGTLNLTGGASNLGWNITGAGTTVQTSTAPNANNFSGFNLNNIGAGSTLRARNVNVFSNPSAFDGGAGPGGGTLDLNGFSQTFSTVGTALNVTNSTAALASTVNLSFTNTTGVHTGVISDGAGKVTVATFGVTAQGSGFDTGMVAQTFAGANTYTGSTSLGRSTVTLDFTNAAAPASNILYNTGFVNANALGAATDGRLIISRPTNTFSTVANSSTGTLLNLNVLGKNATTNSQAFNGLQLDANAGASVLVRGGTGGTATVDFGAIARNSGSVINFATGGAASISTPATGAISTNTLTLSTGPTGDVNNFAFGMAVTGTGIATNATVTAVNYATGVVTLSANHTGAVTAAVAGSGSQTIPLTPSGIIRTSTGTANTVLLAPDGVAYATVAGRDWAAKNSANDAIVAVGTTGSTTAVYTTSTNSTLSGNATTPRANNAGNDVRLAANTTIDTLRIDSNSTRVGISLGGNTLTTGGILVTPQANSSGNFLNGGTLKSPGSDVVLMQYPGSSNRFFGLGAVVADGAAATGFTKGGIGITHLMANNTYTGALNVQQGMLVVVGNNTPSGTFINGSTTNVMAAQLPGANTNGVVLQLGNSNALGSIGSGSVDVGANSIFAIKRTDAFTVNNDIRGMGGFTQGGSGTTTLLSAATAKYSYQGDTTVTAGTLKLDYAASNTGIINDASSLRLGGGTVEYATAAGTTTNDAVRDTRLIPGASTITKSGTGAGRFRLNAIVGGTGGTLNITADNIVDTDSTNTNGIIGSPARTIVNGANWAVNSTNGGDGAIIGLATYGVFNLTGADPTVNALQSLTAPITLGAGTRTLYTLKLDNVSGSSQSLDLATNILALNAGGLLVTGTSEVQIKNGTLQSAASTTAATDLVIHQYNSGGLTIGAVIANNTTNANTLTKSGTGTLVLSGNNTYTGQTFLNGGITSISSNANLGVPVNAATLNLNNATLQATNSVILSNGAVGTNNRAINLNGTGGTFDVVNAGEILTVGGQIAGPGGLTKIGAGTLDVRNNFYTGPTNVNAGTLRYGAAVNNTFSAVNIGPSGTVDTFGFFNSVGSIEGTGVITNSGAAATFSFGGLNTDTTFAGQITQTAALATSIDKFGGGTTTLTGGTHNYTGSTTVSGGTLALSGNGALPIATNVTVSSATGVFDINAVTATGVSIGSLAGAVGSQVVLGSKLLTLTNATGANYAGVISGSGGVTSARSGASNQTLSGANTYDGVTTITSGTIIAASNTALGSTVGNTVINSNGSNATGGQLNIGSAAGGVTIAENITIQGTGDGAPNFNNVVSGAGGVTSTLNGTITLTGTNSYRVGSQDANTFFNVGLITRSTPSAGLLILSPSGNSTISVNTAIDNNGGGIIVHGGGGTAILSASNNDIGSVLVQNFSNLRITASDALALNQNLTVGQGALVNTGAGNGNDVATFTVDAATQTINSLFGYANAGTLPNNTTPTTSRVVTSTTAGAKSLTVGNGNGSGGFDGVISNGTGGGTLAFTKVGTGTQSLLGTVANTYTGDTTVNGGILALGKTAGINAVAGNLVIGNGVGGLDIVRLDNSDQIADTSSISLNGSGLDAGTIRLNTFNETVAGFSSTGGAGVVENGSAIASTSVFTTNFASGIQTFSGLIQDGGVGALSLTKNGLGTQIISGANTFSGATVIDGGILLANNASGSALGTSNVGVNATGTFGGTGEITGGVTLAGGTLSPGASIESLTIGSAGGIGSLLVEYDSSAQTIDMLNVTGALDVSAFTLNFADLGAGSLTNTAYVFATYGSLTGNFLGINSLPSGASIDYQYLGANNIALVTAVPEPGTLALLTVAIVGGGIYRRSRNAKKAAAKS